MNHGHIGTQDPGNASTLSPAFRALAALIAIFAVVAVQSLATQHVAYQLGNPSAFEGERLYGTWYAPWAWFGPWRDLVVAHYPSVYLEARAIAVSGTAGIAVVAALVALRRRKRAQADESLHGTAHWATPAEIRDCGLLPRNREAPDGVFVGGWTDRNRLHYLRHSGPEHVLCFAPTRSGKGVGLVLPTLLTWPHSVLVHDPKGEAWALSAGWRQQHAGTRTIKFDPGAQDGARYNPLAEIRLATPQEVADAQNVATMIVDPDGKGLSDHWAKVSQALLTGCILHVLYMARAEGATGSLADVVELLSQPDQPIREALERMLTAPHLDSGESHPLVAGEAQAALNKEDKELSSTISSVMSYLTLYRDPLVAENTSESDFAIEDLMHAERPLSLYLVVRPPDQERMRPLVRLLVAQVVRRLTETLEFQDGRVVPGYRHRLLLLLDEFASLRRLAVIEEGLAIMAGYGIKAYLIVQDLQQLTKAYGREESIVGNCHLRIAYAPNKIDTAELLSKMTGKATVVRTKRSLSGSKGTLKNVSESLQEVGRPLLTPDEVMRLPGAIKDRNGNIEKPGDMLLFVAGHAPIYGTQVLYFQDPSLAARSKLEPPPHAS